VKQFGQMPSSGHANVRDAVTTTDKGAAVGLFAV